MCRKAARWLQSIWLMRPVGEESRKTDRKETECGRRSPAAQGEVSGLSERKKRGLNLQKKRTEERMRIFPKRRQEESYSLRKGTGGTKNYE